jgi:hypothetical protein
MKIITRIKSAGIGNIIFQLIAAHKLSVKYEADLYVDIYDKIGSQMKDKNTFTEQEELIRKLGKFLDIKIKIASRWHILMRTGLIFRGTKFGNLWEKIINKLDLIKKNHYIERDYFKYKNIEKNKNLYLDGYFQNIEYINNVEIKIKYENNLINEIQKKIEDCKENNSIAIHVRRGDYLNLQTLFCVMDIEYYKKSIKIIEANIKNPYYFILTDDIEWARENLAYINNAILISELTKDAFEDFYLMTLCSNFIIPNSTFSWWAAELNSNNKKIVIVPKKWYIKQEEEIFNLIPKSWHAI